MARESIDYRKMMFASSLTMGIGVILVIISVILELLSLALGGSYGPIFEMLSSAFILIMFPVFLVLFFWTGMRSAKNYGLDAVQSGFSTAFAYLVIALVELVLEIALAAVVITRPLGGEGFGSTKMVIISSIFGGVVGLKGVALTGVCGLGMILIGALINFVIGGFGALFALRKR